MASESVLLVTIETYIDINARYLKWIYYHFYEVEAPASYAGLSTIDAACATAKQSQIQHQSQRRCNA